MTTLAERIAEARTSLGLNRAEFGRLCKVTRAAVGHWESGLAKSLKAETAYAISQATGFSQNWLINGSGPKKTGMAAPGLMERAASDSHAGVVEWGEMTRAATLCQQLESGLIGLEPKLSRAIVKLLNLYTKDREEGLRVAEAVTTLLACQER